MIKKADWLAVAKDRAAVMLLLALAVACVTLVVVTILRLHPSDIQIPVRYTGFGQTFIYRDQWYTMYSYAGFAAIVAGINTFLAIRLYQLRRMLGLSLLGISVFIIILALIVSNVMFNLAPSI